MAKPQRGNVLQQTAPLGLPDLQQGNGSTKNGPGQAKLLTWQHEHFESYCLSEACPFPRMEVQQTAASPVKDLFF